MSSTDALLEVQDVVKRFGDMILNDTVNMRAAVGLLGHNGAAGAGPHRYRRRHRLRPARQDRAAQPGRREEVPSEKGPQRKVYSLNGQGREYLGEFWRTWSFLNERLEPLHEGGR